LLKRGLFRFKNFLKIFYTAKILFPRFYSQTGEDMILNQMLGKRRGMYVDIGSGNPIWNSNTYFLYRRGWSGVLIDPIEKNIKYSRMVRPRDKSILGVVSSKEISQTFYEFKAYEYSTLDKSLYTERLAAGLELKASYEVKVINFENIAALVDTDLILVLSIDAEGSELQILKGINFKTFAPSIILVEELKFEMLKTSEVFDLLTQKGYELKAFTGYTSVYNHKSFKAF
jgi:hypothetical protein